nr:circumsporozoite protein-like [Nomia melanderi]
MRQVVVLEPAGSVLVIRQTSLGGGVTTGNTNSNAGSNNGHETHGLGNHAAVSTIASNDHNQNRIVVVRSSSSTCMTTTADNHVSANGNGNVNVNVNVNANLNANLNGNAGGIVSKTSSKVGVGGGGGGGGGGSKASERNDHPRNDHKSQDGIGTGESNAGCRPRTSKEAAHENVSLDRKLDGADPISDGDPIKLPENLETLPRAEHFPTQRHRWNTNEVSHTQTDDPNLET